MTMPNPSISETVAALEARASRQQAFAAKVRKYDWGLARIASHEDEATFLRTAARLLRELEAAIAPFVAATGEYPDGNVWVEPDRVPGHAWADLRRAATTHAQLVKIGGAE